MIDLNNVIIAVGLAAALTSNLLNRRKLSKVHDEVKSPNGHTTGYAVTQLVKDVEYLIGKSHEIEHLGETVDDLTKLVAAHMSDEHGPSQFPSQKRTTQRRRAGS